MQRTYRRNPQLDEFASYASKRPERVYTKDEVIYLLDNARAQAERERSSLSAHLALAWAMAGLCGLAFILSVSW